MLFLLLKHLLRKVAEHLEVWIEEVFSALTFLYIEGK